MFDHMTITEFRRDTARVADQVRRSRRPLLLTQGCKEPLVLSKLSDFHQDDDTSYLMSRPRTHQEMLAAISRVNSEEGLVTKTMSDLEKVIADAETRH